MTERSELTVFKRKIGTCTGWDDISEMVLVFYNFEPSEGFDMPNGDLTINYENGIFQNYNDDGDVVLEKDFMIVMNGLIARQNRV